MSLIYVKPNFGGYFFDVTFRETHDFENVITQNPVQSGAAVNDHVYQQPISFTCDIGVSDCLASIKNGQFESAATRSLSAFDVLVGLWQHATIIDVTTLYTTYQSMIIKSLIITKDKTTMTALRATVTFQQLIITNAVDVSLVQAQSSDPQTTQNTVMGPVQTAQNVSFKYPTLSMATMSMGSAQATYNGKTWALTEYFNQYSTSKISTSGDFPVTSTSSITPIISPSITNNTVFEVDGKTLTYDQLTSQYGK